MPVRESEFRSLCCNTDKEVQRRTEVIAVHLHIESVHMTRDPSCADAHYVTARDSLKQSRFELQHMCGGLLQ